MTKEPMMADLSTLCIAEIMRAAERRHVVNTARTETRQLAEVAAYRNLVAALDASTDADMSMSKYTR